MTAFDHSIIIEAMSAVAENPDLQHRAAVFAALGEPSRLAIIETLTLTDCSPSELEDRLGIPSNLLAHHLDTLESAGLVLRLRSEGDGRRRYVRLAPDLPDGLVRTARVEAANILFVCRHNAARSQFAAAYWNRHSTIPAESAGTQPAAHVHPLAVQAAGMRGLDLSGQVPRGYDPLHGAPGLVVSVCDLAFEHAVLFPNARHLHWSVPDPASRSDLKVFEDAFDEIAHRIDRLGPCVVATQS
ncbi:MAG: helix-turn-helix domain-containing protein [Ardenticatenales bacterium]